MYSFTAQQRFTALVWLSLFHIAIITSSNYGAAADHRFRLPYHTGRLYLPVYLHGDRSDRAHFRRAAGAADYLAVMVPALFISYVISTVTYQGEWQGFAALGSFNLFVARIAVASFMAYVLGQILDVHVFNRLRQRSARWVAPAAAMFFGNISDTLAFFFIAFYKSSDPFMANNWVEIALVDYSFKVMICLLFFLPMYGVLLNMLLKRIAARSGSLQLS